LGLLPETLGLHKISLRIAMKIFLQKLWADQLWADQEGQDLIEYTLLLAFITLSVAGLMSRAGSSANTIWSAASTALSNAVTKAGGS
jgi:Flp pilus assembly pilin Flp